MRWTSLTVTLVLSLSLSVFARHAFVCGVWVGARLVVCVVCSGVLGKCEVRGVVLGYVGVAVRVVRIAGCVWCSQGCGEWYSSSATAKR